MIKVDNVTFNYRKGAPIFSHLSLNFGKGKIYGLLGKNGVGKSTLLYLMSGLLFTKKGSILVHNQPIQKRMTSTLQDIFLVPDELELPFLSLSEYIQTYSPFYPKFNKEQMKEYLSIFDIQLDPRKTPLRKLSLGEKKKIFISFSFATNTSILLMDEPTNGLDIEGKRKFRKITSLAMTENKTMIISTHQVKEVDKLLDHIIILGNNKVYLNQSAITITEKIAFLEGHGAINPDDILYKQPKVNGDSLMVKNSRNLDTELDIEMLYNAFSEDHRTIKELFNP